MPPLGVVNLYGKGYPVKLLGKSLLEKSVAETAWMIKLGKLHGILAFGLVALVLAHFCSPLYHHSPRYDDTLRRVV